MVDVPSNGSSSRVEGVGLGMGERQSYKLCLRRFYPVGEGNSYVKRSMKLRMYVMYTKFNFDLLTKKNFK